MKSTLFAAVSLLALGACQALSDPVICPAYVPPAVIVTAVDSLTNANVTPGATITLANADFSATAVANPEFTSMSVGGRPGTFTVTVAQAGYRVWTKTGVKVEEGQCGVKTVNLTARLQTAP